MREAQEAAIRGDHLAAAEHWRLASQFADLQHVRDEAIYRQATSLGRAGEQEQSSAILRELASAPGSRQERAAYDLATQALLATPSDDGKLLEATLERFPGSGVARGAMDRWLRRLTPSERLVVLDRLGVKITERTLSERILLQRGRALQALGRFPEAEAVYSRLVKEYPYPAGQYWDEALLHKATLQAHVGRRREAIETLEEMLSYREVASIAGTYERRYALAKLMLARLWATEDWKEAYALLLDFPSLHDVSRELDEALWAAALLARDNGDEKRTCDAIDVLRKADPRSRYAACGAALCPKAGPLATAPCHDYVLETRTNFDDIVLRATAPYSRVDENDSALER